MLDEADRMLDMGFIHDIRRIIKLLPQKRQNLLFSATYSDDIRALAERLLHDPLSIQVAPRNAPIELVEQRAYRVQKEQKRHLLVHLIQEGQWHQVLIFTRTKHGANRLTQQLEGAGIQAAAIHGNKSQAARVKALDMFKRGQVTAWSPPKSPRAASTSRSCRKSSITNCPTCPRTTCIASAAPAAPAPRARRSRWSRPMSPDCCATSSGCLSRSIPTLPTPVFKIVESAAPAPSREGRPPHSPQRHAGQYHHGGGRRAAIASVAIARRRANASRPNSGPAAARRSN